MVYTLRQKSIFLKTERYIPHGSEVYSSRQKGIFLTAVRYIPQDGKVYSSRQKGIFLTVASSSTSQAILPSKTPASE